MTSKITASRGPSWDYFGSRIAKDSSEDGDEERYEAVPFRFHGLTR